MDRPTSSPGRVHAEDTEYWNGHREDDDAQMDGEIDEEAEAVADQERAGRALETMMQNHFDDIEREHSMRLE